MTTVRVFDVAIDWLVEQDVDEQLPADARRPLLDDLEQWRDLLIQLRDRRIDEKNLLLERHGSQHVAVKMAGAAVQRVQMRLSEVNRLRRLNGATVEAALRDAVVRDAVAWRRGSGDLDTLASTVDGFLALADRRAS